MNLTPLKIAAGMASLLVSAQPTLPAQMQPVTPCEPTAPQEVLDLLAHPQQIAPGVQYTLPGRQEVFTIQGAKGKEFNQEQQLRSSLELARRANLKVPSSVLQQQQQIKAIRLTGEASTYGYGDGLYGQLTSSGQRAVDGVAALEMDLAHTLSSQGAIPYSMAGVKAVVQFPSGRTVVKRLADKGSLFNPITEAGWKSRLQQAKVDDAGVADLGTVPYRILDIVAPLNKFHGVTITVPFHHPISMKKEQPPARALQELSRWAVQQGGKAEAPALQCQA